MFWFSLTAVAYYDVLELNGCKRMKDLIVTVSLIRPSWMAALILALFLRGKKKKYFKKLVESYFDIFLMICFLIVGMGS